MQQLRYFNYHGFWFIINDVLFLGKSAVKETGDEAWSVTVGAHVLNLRIIIMYLDSIYWSVI